MHPIHSCSKEDVVDGWMDVASDVGLRLAYGAMNVAYGKDQYWTGPLISRVSPLPNDINGNGNLYVPQFLLIC
jgi:hypothetical protein